MTALSLSTQVLNSTCLGLILHQFAEYARQRSRNMTTILSQAVYVYSVQHLLQAENKQILQTYSITFLQYNQALVGYGNKS